MDVVDEAVTRITKRFSPISIFVYGSRAREDFLDESDYEIGVIFDEGSRARRSELAEVAPEGCMIYPFTAQGIHSGMIDTPFQPHIFLRELSIASRTVWGERVVEGLFPPPIRLFDIAEDVRFHAGLALAALISMRNGDSISASWFFYKSCLYSMRAALILHEGEFLVNYEDIAARTEADLPRIALDIRHGRTTLSQQDVFRNISFINSLSSSLEGPADRVVLP